MIYALAAERGSYNANAGLLLLFFQKVGISQFKWSFIPGMLFKVGKARNQIKLLLCKTQGGR